MKSIEPKLLELLERYVADELSEKERDAFEGDLEEKPELADVLDFFLAFEAEKEDFGRILMKTELQKIDAEMKTATSMVTITSLTVDALQRIADVVDKTIEEVSRWFQPIPEYQVLLGGVDRSEGLRAKTPAIGGDYTNGVLTFEFDQSGDFLITVENNRREIVVKKRVEKEEKKVLVEVSGYPMGVYYWNVIDLSRELMIRGDFLVTLG